jgi:hypothetical protein
VADIRPIDEILRDKLIEAETQYRENRDEGGVLESVEDFQGFRPVRENVRGLAVLRGAQMVSSNAPATVRKVVMSVIFIAGVLPILPSSRGCSRPAVMDPLLSPSRPSPACCPTVRNGAAVSNPTFSSGRGQKVTYPCFQLRIPAMPAVTRPVSG